MPVSQKAPSQRIIQHPSRIGTVEVLTGLRNEMYQAQAPDWEARLNGLVLARRSLEYKRQVLEAGLASVQEAIDRLTLQLQRRNLPIPTTVLDADRNTNLGALVQRLHKAGWPQEEAFQYLTRIQHNFGGKHPRRALNAAWQWAVDPPNRRR